MDWAEERSLMGFRKNGSKMDCLLILNTGIELALSQKKQLYVCFVDFKKALNHKLLWSCLSSIGVSQRILAVLQSLLHPRVSGYPVTDLFKCQRGVRQGCI